MKTLYTFLILASFSSAAFAQTNFASDLSTWANGNPTDWMNSARTSIPSSNVVQSTVNVQAGTSAAQLKNTTGSGLRFASDSFAVAKGDIMSIKIWARGKGELGTRIWETSFVGSISYKALDSVSWGVYSYSWVADTTINNAELLIYARNTDSTEGHLFVDSVWVGKGTAATKTIYDIQHTTLSTGVSPLAGQLVTTKGVVTAVAYNGYFIQDGDSAWSGIWVFDQNNVPTTGDEVEITGTVKEYFGITEIENPSMIVLSSGNSSPVPVIINTGDAVEKYEGVLVQVQGNCTADTASDNSGVNWRIDDGSGEVMVQDLIYLYPNVTVNQQYTVVGPLNFAWSEFRIVPRALTDVITGLFELNTPSINITIYPNPATQYFFVSGTEINDNISIFDINGKMVKQINAKSNIEKISIQGFDEGVYFIKVENEISSGVRRMIVQ